MKQNHILKTLSKTLTRTRPISFTRSLSSSSSSLFAIKNVTKSNFDDTLNDLRRHVRDADFVSIDLEMTGVTSAPWRESLEFDRFDIRYLKVKDSAEKFAVVQFGVCPFKWDPLNQSFIAHPHNFYIFPRQEIPGDDQSHEFLCQTSSIDFLAKYQFDFNLCIREGISYLSKTQEEKALKRLNTTFEDELVKEVSNTSGVKMSDILFSERMKNNIFEWNEGLLRNKHVKSEFHTIFFNSRPALVLDGFTSHQLRLIQMIVRKHFNHLEFIRVPGQNLIVYTESGNDRELLKKQVKDCRYKEGEMKIKNATGFRKVIDLLSSEEKLIVGHNCFLDIAHIYSKFIAPLPSTIEEFAHSVQKHFPFTIDTKLILNSNDTFNHLVKKNSTSLSKAFSLLCPQIASGIESSSLSDKSLLKIEVQVDNQRSLNWNSGANHEAGYDAFMTGCIFAQACNYLTVNFTEKLATNNYLKSYVNNLYLSWINGDVFDLSVAKSKNIAQETKISRYPKIKYANIVILWGLGSNLKANEIKECLVKVFGEFSVTYVYHLDQSAALIQFSKESMVDDFLKLKEKLERSKGYVTVLNPTWKIFESGNVRVGGYDVYKEICGSHFSEISFTDQAEAVGIEEKGLVNDDEDDVCVEEARVS